MNPKSGQAPKDTVHNKLTLHTSNFLQDQQIYVLTFPLEKQQLLIGEETRTTATDVSTMTTVIQFRSDYATRHYFYKRNQQKAINGRQNFA